MDTAVYHGIRDNYDCAPVFAGRMRGVPHDPRRSAPTVVVGANPQGLLGANDDTDRIRHIERLQFTDETVAIDSDGNIISSSLIHFASPTQIANYETVYGKYYDAVPFGTPTMTENGPGRQSG